MAEVKCKWCNNKGEKAEMEVESKGTGKFNKNGSEKMTNKYFHSNCYIKYIEDKKFKEEELTKWDNLYQHIKSLHKLEVLDARMIEKLQDLRNGTIKVKIKGVNKKVTRYKEGVSYELMLDTYKHLEVTITNIIDRMHFAEKWNEFSYIFGTVVKNLDEVKIALRRKQQQELKMEIQKEKLKANPVDLVETIQVKTKTKKKDELDITSFL